MKSCNVNTLTNGENSLLYKSIEGFASTNEQIETFYKYFLDNQEFIKDFGNWQEDFKKGPFERTMSERVDENGEPKLLFDDQIKKYYYVNKYNSKVYFPLAETKLEDVFTKTRIKSISKALALNFFKSRFNENFDEIDLGVKRGTLRDSIIEKLTAKITEFKKSDDLGQVTNAVLLQDSLLSIDEWVKEVQDYFLSIRLVHKESTMADDLMEEENSGRGQTFGISSFEKSTKDNISANIKLRLSLLINNDELDETLLEPIFRDFDDVYSSLLGYLTNKVPIEGVDIFEEMMTTIHSLIDKKPYMQDLYNILRQSDDYLKAEFVQAFNLHKNNFIGSIYSSTAVSTIEVVDGKKEVVHKTINTHAVQNFSSVGAKHSVVKNNWFYNFTKKFTNGSGEITKEGIEKLAKIKKHYDSIFLDFNKKASKKGYYTDQNLPVDVFVKALNTLGIITTSEGFNHYLDNLEASALNLDQRLHNLKALSSSIKYFLDDIAENKVDLTEGENVLNKQVAFNNLARAEAFFLREGSDSSIFTVNKNKWVYSYPSYLSTKVKQWKANKQLLLDQYNTVYNRGSHFMKFLLALDVEESKRDAEATKRLNDFEINTFNSFQREGDALNAVDNKDISKADAYADAYHKLLGYRVKGKSTYIQTATPADKSTLIQIKTPDGMMLKTNPFMEGGVIRVSEEAKSILLEYVKAEYNRIKEVSKEIQDAKGDNTKLRMFYHLGPKNGLKFQLLNSLNPENFDSEKMGFELYTHEGTILKRLNFDEITIKNGLDKHIETVLNGKIKDMYLHLQDIGLLERREGGKVVNKAFSNDIWESYDRTPALGIASDIVVNGLISQVEYSKMFAGDVAFYKNVTDYKKRIPATYTDGLQLYLREGEEHFKVGIIDDVVIKTPFYDNLKELIGEELALKYTNIDSTDAQAWITTTRWKFLKERLGQWSKAHDVVYAKMTGKNTEDFTKEELKMAAQPLKGVYFEINNGIPVYLKYSQAVLVPNLIKNSPELRKLHAKMIKKDVEEAITAQGIKVGANQPVVSHNEDGTIKHNFSFSPITLKNSGWKLQQDLPTKTFKQTDVGSQIQKNIYEALTSKVNLENIFQVGDKEMTGKELIIHINSIVEELSDRGFSMFTEEFDISSDGTINNTDKINKALIKELKQRGAPSNVVKALESGVSPLGIPGYSQKLQNIFASITLDRVVKIKTNGGAFIQMSNYGLNNAEASEKGVLWAPWAKKTAHEYEYIKDKDGKIATSESGKPLVRPAGILLTGSFIAKYVPDYASKSLSEIFGTAEKQYKDGLIDKKILENIIGYRIPNQALASNDALEVVGILPEEMGDTIIAYTGITTKTGSDFDIDKMYLMFPNIRPDYKHKAKLREYAHNYLRGRTIKETIDNITKITDQIGSEGVTISDERFAKILLSPSNKELLHYEVDNFIEAVLHTDNALTTYIKEFIPDYNEVKGIRYVNANKEISKSSTGGLQNKLIEAYKGALLNENTIKEVMTPIDFPFIKDNIMALVPSTEIKDFDTFDIQKEIELKFEFNAGVAGVGITANALVDHIRGLMADISLDTDLGTSLVHETTTDTAKFDEEYSKSLTDRELKEYMIWLNKSKPKGQKLTAKDMESLKKIRISQSISAYLNAFVDIAKDPYITRGHWTTQTSNTGFMLLRAGLHPFYVNAILAQPIIGEYIDFTVNKESIIGNESGDMKEKFIKDKTEQAFREEPDFIEGNIVINYVKLFNSVKGDITQAKLQKLFGKNVTLEQTKTVSLKYIEITDKFKEDKKAVINIFNLKDLLGQLNNSDVGFQLETFFKFVNWQQESKKLVNNINASKLDVNGYGKNNIEMIIAKNLMAKMLNVEAGGIVNFKSKLSFDNKKSLLGAYSDNILDEVMNIMQANHDYFLISHPTMVATVNEISMQLKEELLVDKKLAGKLDKAFHTYIMSGFSPFQMSEAVKKSLLRETVREVSILKDKKDEETNLLIEELDIKIGEVGQTFLSMNNRKKSVDEQGLITNAWLDLFDENKELAEKLVKYAYLTSGFQMNMNQFYSYIPYEWFVENGINSYAQEAASIFNGRTIDYTFIEQFFRHNIEDNQIVRNIFPSQVAKGYAGNYIGFLVEDARITNPFLKREYINDQTMVSSTFLYKRIGLSEEGHAIYTRIETLGTNSKGNKIFEYDINNSNTNTITRKGMVVESIRKATKKYSDMVVEAPTKKVEDSTVNVEQSIATEETTKALESSEQLTVEFDQAPDELTGMGGAIDIEELMKQLKCKE